MQLAQVLKTMLIRLIAAGLMLTAVEALLPKGEGGVSDGAKRLIRLALLLAVLSGLAN